MSTLSAETTAASVAWPAGIEDIRADLLQGGELGFLEAGPAGFRIIPCPWSALKDVPIGPYDTRNGALDAVLRHLSPSSNG